MSMLYTYAWKCDYRDCGHVWLAYQKKESEEWRRPDKCSKCRRRNWDQDGKDK